MYIYGSCIMGLNDLSDMDEDHRPDPNCTLEVLRQFLMNLSHHDLPEEWACTWNLHKRYYLPAFIAACRVSHQTDRKS